MAISAITIIFLQFFSFCEVKTEREYKIIDSKGEEIQGASIRTAQSNLILYSKSNGTFKIPISLVKKNPEITVDFISYKTKVFFLDEIDYHIVLSER
jgi:hypothetical protein